MAADYYISDYRLPGMDGLQLLDAIQAKIGRTDQGSAADGEHIAGSNRTNAIFPLEGAVQAR